MKKIKSHYSELIELSEAVRNSTIKRLKQVPPGKENWRISPGAMSFADITSHLIDTDEWLFQKIRQKELAPILGVAGSVTVPDYEQYLKLVENLIESGKKRTKFISGLSERDLKELIYDDRFGKEVSVWWIIVRGNFDHEIHHRGAIAVALRVLNDSKDN